MKTLIPYFSIAFCMLIGHVTQAQGEQLFKAKCNTCHLVDKNSTGPLLKGAKQKWTDAGEGELIYEWVKNPAGLIASGKSQMAAKIKDFSLSEMTAQTVSNEEIDAILSYVDGYIPPPPPVKVSGDPASSAAAPDYKGNLQLFYLLLGCTFVLLVAILLVSNSIISLVKTDFFKKKLQERNSESNPMKIGLILLTVGMSMMPDSLFAMKYTAPGTTTEPTLWLLVEKSDLYLLLTLNVILLGVLLYLRRVFNSFMAMIREEKQMEVENTSLKRINKILTDAVPVTEEEKIMLHHEYDGIRELDNNLPPWWVWGFFATIVFAVVYLFNYHVFKTGDLQLKAYEKDMKQSEKEVQQYLSKMAMNVDENSATILTEDDDLSAGKSIFQSNCVTCHKSKGEGDIGPNLTDKTWIYGYDVKEVFKTIKFGTPVGMPEHNSKLNPIQIQQVSSYVLQLPETKGKPAQGSILEK